ncbi:3-deoxy-7-phosphoheptulonate synthase [Lapidilactobacillus dextrinicus]|uniref:3-deoxy-7-phosphoheptulonate synthase n=1 Tax=Lapidilactobacillus dextrinicus TaxID=51664 RepID=UPI0022E81B11|nr:3-deoxy-7-phosphoheptulonate synthase [Lapidilactobacillus dextrinicus]
MIIQFKTPMNHVIVDDILEQMKKGHHHGVMSDNHLIIYDLDHFDFTDREASVIEHIEATQPRYALSSRKFQPEDTIIETAHNKIGGDNFTVMAGPCSVENEEMIHRLAAEVKAAGATVIRGGAFKPRTSPYDFQGLGVEGLRYLREAADENDLDVITEVMSVEEVETISEYTDIFQIGARNMQNFDLLKAVGKTDKPVALKRGLAATIDEWLNAAEYIISEGNSKVMLVERGIRSFDSTYTRNILDVGAIAVVKKSSHFPIIVDSSHAAGHADLVAPMAYAGVAAGAQGLLIEVHDHPSQALSDAAQQLTPAQFTKLVAQAKKIHALTENHD